MQCHSITATLSYTVHSSTHETVFITGASHLFIASEAKPVSSSSHSQFLILHAKMNKLGVAWGLHGDAYEARLNDACHSITECEV